MNDKELTTPRDNLFLVTRTSNQKPEGCFSVNITKTKRCYTTRKDKVVARTPDDWYDSGENHRADDNGVICKDIGIEEVFAVEIESIEELMDFEKNSPDQLIIGVDEDGFKTIEIYDDYRE